MENKEPMAYDLHYNEIREVVTKHLNEWPNRLIGDLAELIRNKNDQALEGMVLMTTEEFGEVERRIREEERKKREEMVEEALEKGRWQGVMASMNTLATHTDQIWQSTIQKDSIYKYIDDVQAEAEQKLQALTQPNNPE